MYRDLGAVTAPTLGLLFGPVGMVASMATCKARCEWSHPFSRARQQQCKDACEQARMDRIAARHGTDDDTTTLPPEAGSPIVPLLLLGGAALGVYWLFFRRST